MTRSQSAWRPLATVVPRRILPMVIFSKVRLGLNPEINALAAITVLLVGIFVLIANYLMLSAQRTRMRAMAAAMREPAKPDADGAVATVS